MELFGREIKSEKDLVLSINRMSVEECKSTAKLIALNRKQMAEERMNKEQNPIRKQKMQSLINQGEYNFDLLFGPERR